MRRVLFITSELYPFIKTGGLADVSASLPRALQSCGQDLRIAVPAYADLAFDAAGAERVGTTTSKYGPVTLLETTLPDCNVPVILIQHPLFSEKHGNPYLAANGDPWPDNAQRFSLFAEAVLAIAQGDVYPAWRPDIVHCNDWQSGLVPVLLARQASRPATVFTIHNLAYQGLFPRATFIDLGLPEELWSPGFLEFYGQLSFMKGGLMFADRINTVSPSYAREIQTEQYGCGLHGLLVHRSAVLSGILNGIDTEEWNPSTDRYLTQRFDERSLEARAQNKSSVQEEFGLPLAADIPVIGLIGRLALQKGIDIVLEALPDLLAMRMQIVLLGTGDKNIEQALLEAAQQHPRALGVRIGFDERLAHMIEGGADIFLMPSRYEPCGLNQMYSMRYGTVPVVRRTGGLADTVVDATPSSIADGAATGVAFENETAPALADAMSRALSLYSDNTVWRRIQSTCMRQDFSWGRAAREYVHLYDQALSGNR